MDEKNDFFVRAGQMEDEDELMDELNELEAQMEDEELAKLEIGAGALHMGLDVPAQKQPAARAQVNLQQSEEDELKALEALMN